MMTLFADPSFNKWCFSESERFERSCTETRKLFPEKTAVQDIPAKGGNI